ncbi:hypothetical protein NJB93_19965 [Brucella intermedia]|uniref:hypothetical protein n=1 Tax=Brucella intermedia TaxID=94625 RepID=UPI00209A666C|nr:hypothetical protein [Brucella intermedia]MCO7728854.1 hypothetical protein [Brucella intermedia]
MVSIGLTYHFFVYRTDGLRKEMELSRNRNHDAKLVYSFQEKYTEPRFEAVLRTIQDDHSLMSDDASFMMSAASMLRSANFHLLDKQVKQKADILADRIADLSRFTNAEFFVMQNATSQDRRCLRPDWNPDRAGFQVPTALEEAKYSNLATTVYSLTSAVFCAYSDFVETAHQRVL